jgi:hypothetical protein
MTDWVPHLAQICVEKKGDAFITNHSAIICHTFRKLVKLDLWLLEYAGWPARCNATIHLRELPSRTYSILTDWFKNGFRVFIGAKVGLHKEALNICAIRLIEQGGY